MKKKKKSSRKLEFCRNEKCRYLENNWGKRALLRYGRLAPEYQLAKDRRKSAWRSRVLTNLTFWSATVVVTEVVTWARIKEDFRNKWKITFSFHRIFAALFCIIAGGARDSIPLRSPQKTASKRADGGKLFSISFYSRAWNIDNLTTARGVGVARVIGSFWLRFKCYEFICLTFCLFVLLRGFSVPWNRRGLRSRKNVLRKLRYTRTRQRISVYSLVFIIGL